MFSLHHPISRGRMLTLCLALLGGLALAGWWQAGQDAGAALRADTLRLHIRADSDSVRDQTCKLAVRDAVLALTERLWPRDASPSEAREAAARSLPAIQWAARRTLARLGQEASVQVSLVNMYFDTTRYAGCALPAGRYDALRAELVVRPLPGPVRRRLRRLRRPGRDRPCLRGVYPALPCGGVVAAADRPAGGPGAGPAGVTALSAAA